MATAFQLCIELRDFKPAIYRDVLVDSATPLSAHSLPYPQSTRKIT
jgi:hypothetical protein